MDHDCLHGEEEKAMGLLNFLKKEKIQPLTVNDDAIVAVADGKLIDITTVNDPVFSEKMMGDGVAFGFYEDEVTICAPANGQLTVLFPTGHAFGITMKNGVELLVHIGLDTVNAGGDGFTILHKKQGEEIKAGEAVVAVNMKKLQSRYDMSTMLIVTNAKGHKIHFIEPVNNIKRGQSLII